MIFLFIVYQVYSSFQQITVCLFISDLPLLFGNISEISLGHPILDPSRLTESFKLVSILLDISLYDFFLSTL